MSTPPRQFQVGIPYHIYNRGNRKGKIFLDTKDYQRFLRRMKEYKNQHAIEIFCYCFMPNHFHLLLLQREEEAITKFMLRLSTSFSKYFNIKHELVGRLFQERFRAKIVETDEYLLHLSRYIHLNPISENIEELAQLSSRSTPGVEREKHLSDYPWSSYPEYCGTEKKQICNTEFILSYFSKTLSQLSYQSFVEGGIPKDESEIISHFL